MVEGELTPETCPLASTHVLWHVCTQVHIPSNNHTQTERTDDLGAGLTPGTATSFILISEAVGAFNSSFTRYNEQGQ